MSMTLKFMKNWLHTLAALIGFMGLVAAGLGMFMGAWFGLRWLLDNFDPLAVGLGIGVFMLLFAVTVMAAVATFAEDEEQSDE